MSDARHRLRILHVSDLHARCLSGPNAEREPARRYRILADAWERNLAEVLQDGPIDLVCFTGDAADWGLPRGRGCGSTLDPTLLEQAREALGALTKSETIRIALAAVVRQKQLADALDHRGQIDLEINQEMLQELRADG